MSNDNLWEDYENVFEENEEFIEDSEDFPDSTELIIFKDLALSTLKEVRRGLEQLKVVSRKSIEYRLLIIEIERKLQYMKHFIEEIVGEELTVDLDDYYYISSSKYEGKEYLPKIMQLLDQAEKNLRENQIFDAMALILASYEILETVFCSPCSADAS
ncbi:MAG: hypothetical protein ACTSX9_07245 [Candidatus Njordarchaeales archaeon]